MSSPYVIVDSFSIPGVTDASPNGLGPYAPGGTLGMINYAKTDEGCINGKNKQESCMVLID